MRLLISLLKIFFAFAILYTIAAFLGKSSYRVEREALINAPQKLVYSQIAVFRNWEKWSPWVEKDSTMKNTYEGPDGDIGSVMNWTGDEDLSGTGSIRFESMNPPFSVNYVLNFKEPLEMQSKGGFSLKVEAANKTSVNWYDQGKIPFLIRPMMMFMDMDKQLGPDFERGLSRIDAVCTSIYLEMEQVLLQEALQNAPPLQQ